MDYPLVQFAMVAAVGFLALWCGAHIIVFVEKRTGMKFGDLIINGIFWIIILLLFYWGIKIAFAGNSAKDFHWTGLGLIMMGIAAFVAVIIFPRKNR